jgi:hypothetical protein
MQCAWFQSTAWALYLVPDLDAGAGEGVGRSEMVPGNKSAALALF